VKERIDNWSDETTTLGDLFLEQLPILKHYAPYLQGYAPASAALHYLSQHHRPTKTLIERFEVEQQKINRLNVPSFLVMPVQRLPRYVLLLTDLKKYTPEKHPDVEYLTELLPKLQATVSEINKGIDPEKEANMKKTVSIAESISGDGVEDIVRTERCFLKEGAVKWCGVSNTTGKEKGSHKGYCFVFHNLIVVCGTSGKKDKPYVLKRLIPGHSIVNVLSFSKTQSIRISFRGNANNSQPPSPLPASLANPSPSGSKRNSVNIGSDPGVLEPVGGMSDTLSSLCAIRSEVSGAQLLINQSTPAVVTATNNNVLSVKKSQKTLVIKLSSPEECSDWETYLTQVANICREDSISGSAIVFQPAPQPQPQAEANPHPQEQPQPQKPETQPQPEQK